MQRSAVALLVALLVAGCAGPAATRAPDPTPFPTNAVVRLRDAIPATLARETVDFEFDAVITGSTKIKYGTAYGGTGVSTLGGKSRMAMTADFSELGLGELEIMLDEAEAYLRGGFLEARLKPGQWAVIGADSKDPDVIAMSEAIGRAGDIAIVIYFLYGETGPVAQRPPQPLRGLPADRFAVTVDLERAADEAPAGARDSLLLYIDDLRSAGVERTLDAEAWLQDGLIRRLILTYSIEALKGGGTMRITYDFLDFGDPVVLALPKARDIVPIEDLLP